MSQTDKNLMDAFAGESQANRKYLAFAKQADQEGYPQIAKLFRAAADAETVHAHSHLRVAGKINSTKENLADAVSGETHEFTSMYPEMIKAAEEEGNAQAVRTFTFANEVEKIHAELYQKALDDMENKADMDYYVCQVCGYTCENEAPDDCPVCKSKKIAFNKTD